MENMQTNFKQCNICEDTESTIFCPQCFCYYCDDCYKPVHNKKKIKIIKKKQLTIIYQLILGVQIIKKMQLIYFV